MRIADVIRRIESYAPTSLAESYDNVGLLFGDNMREITSALLTLDVDIDVAHEAAEYGANLIVSHHPLIFNPIKTITADSAVGRCLLFLAENKISVYSAHTNLDSAEGGLCDLMAAMIGIENTSPVLPGTGGEGEKAAYRCPPSPGLFLERRKSRLEPPGIRNLGGLSALLLKYQCIGGYRLEL